LPLGLLTLRFAAIFNDGHTDRLRETSLASRFQALLAAHGVEKARVDAFLRRMDIESDDEGTGALDWVSALSEIGIGIGQIASGNPAGAASAARGAGRIPD